MGWRAWKHRLILLLALCAVLLSALNDPGGSQDDSSIREIRGQRILVLRLTPLPSPATISLFCPRTGCAQPHLEKRHEWTRIVRRVDPAPVSRTFG